METHPVVETDRESGLPGKNKTLIKVQVHYIAAAKPYREEAMPSETVGQIKLKALTAFGLKEDGNKVYNLFHKKTELQNLDQAIGELADEKKELKLDLEERLVQG